MKFNKRTTPLNIKLTLLVIAILIAVSTFLYTSDLVRRLQERDRRIVELYAESYNYIINSNTDNIDLTFIFENIIQKIDFPLILTDANDQVNFRNNNGGIRNIDIDTNLTLEQKSALIQKKIKELAEINPPIPITIGKDIVLNKIYYGDSALITRLRYYPFLQIIFAITFILIAYMGFSYLKKSEQSNIWVGMAKETAHQLGTPISSLMGWAEILKLYHDNPVKVIDAADEIESDLGRLNKIAHRFSKIGSFPELKKINLFDLVYQVVLYFERRLPQTGKKVSIEISGDKNVSVNINPDLFEWVIENLIKNALDAIGRKEGKLEILLLDLETTVDIEVADNGKGIDKKFRRDIFRPGYSTKKRGWGLGLSLSKRIVEEYHHGRIFLKNSAVDVGTTFRISLKK